MGSKGHKPAPLEGHGDHGIVSLRKDRWAVDCSPLRLGGSGLVLPGELRGNEAHMGTQEQH